MKTPTKYAIEFMQANVLCVGLAALAGAVSHLFAANLSVEIYEIAIGDHLIPGSPIDSWVVGPILIGAIVSWWFGFIAAPFVFAAKIFGRRQSLKKPLIWFIAAGLSAWAASTAWAVLQHPKDVWSELGTSILIGLLERGNLILAVAFVAFALSRWRGKPAHERS
ncbi:hypothetical protein EON81_00925 [bacterium]|nr:MAG: hypothetical protein EON81_00925 [bacterium]